MRHVRRLRSSPEYLKSQRVLLAIEDAATFYLSRSKASLAQAEHRIDPAILQPLQKVLFDTFGYKCAFCESPASPAWVQAGYFRPPSGAADLDGTVAREHYWWLAFEWGNIYPVCKDCHRAKGPRFPIKGRRAKPRTPYDQVVATERALLLDPCHDDPDEHLLFEPDGRVSSSTERGRVSIEVLALNRKTLVEARARAVSETESADPSDIDPLRPYSAACLQAARLRRSSRSTKKAIKRVHQQFEVYEDGLEAISVEAAAPPQEEYFIKSRMIERIELENFRLFRKLDLRCGSSAADTAPWLMLLGENGLGKSTILQAVALALMGDGLRKRFRFDPRAFLRHGERKGAVRVFMTGVREPVELKITRRGFEASVPPKSLLLAYGSTRLFGLRAPNLPSVAARHARVQNLFNAFVPLANPTAFFRGLGDRKQRDAAARAAKSLLNLGKDDRIVKASGQKMQIVRKSGRESFDDLSDGYRSMLALASDIMTVMFDRWPDMSAAEGIVLIDEIENHLHPSWKMRVVSSLRGVFPRVQFIVTTHDPLCLRGLQNGEVAVLQRAEDDSVFARVDDLPPVAALRVDQLLTSEHFGLSSTIDVTTEELFDRYYKLLAEPDLSPEKIEERDELKRQVAPYTVLGSTRRDRLALEAIDQFLATERRMPDAGERLKLRDETKKRVAELWLRERPPEP